MPPTRDSMDIKQIRKANFEKLLAQYISLGNSDGEKRTLRSFAKGLGMNEVHLSQIKNSHRDIGSRLARKIEARTTPPLPVGWMDHEHRDHDPNSLAEREMTKLVMRLYRESPREVNAVLRKLARTIIGKKQRRGART